MFTVCAMYDAGEPLRCPAIQIDCNCSAAAATTLTTHADVASVNGKNQCRWHQRNDCDTDKRPLQGGAAALQRGAATVWRRLYENIEGGVWVVGATARLHLLRHGGKDVTQLSRATDQRAPG